jgi:glycosyltransferase involved in cell wall biosynthesis
MHVFAPSRDDDTRAEDEGVHLHLLRSPGPVRWSGRATGAVRREGSFDLIWAPEWRGPAWAYSRRRDAGPLVTHLFTSRAMVRELSGGWPRRPAALLEARIQDTLERRQAERSDAILAQSESILEWTRRMWDIDGAPVRVLPSVFDVAETRALADAPLPADLPEGRPRIVFFGRLEPRKGLDVLVRAMPRVWERFPEAELIVFGNGNDELANELRELAGPPRGPAAPDGPPDRHGPLSGGAGRGCRGAAVAVGELCPGGARDDGPRVSRRPHDRRRRARVRHRRRGREAGAA